MFYTFVEDSPVGKLMLAGTEEGLKFLSFSKTYFSSQEICPESDWEPGERKLREPVKQLQAYFSGKLRRFDLPLAFDGTAFQQRVWTALCAIPFGQTASYGDIARAVGNAAACRAVGLANGRNPIAIIVPCHRIIGSNGSLTGYGGGLERKRTLLQLEGSLPQVRKSGLVQRDEQMQTVTRTSLPACDSPAEAGFSL